MSRDICDKCGKMWTLHGRNCAGKERKSLWYNPIKKDFCVLTMDKNGNSYRTGKTEMKKHPSLYANWEFVGKL